VQSSQTVPRLRDLKDLNLFDSPQRNAITWMDDEVFIFGYIGDPAVTAVGDGPDLTSPGSSSIDDETNDGGSPIVYENSENNESTRATEAVNVEPISIFFIPPPHARHAERTGVSIVFVTVACSAFARTADHYIFRRFLLLRP